jgi:uncharacterized protein YndB with AHSA1/START domain
MTTADGATPSTTAQRDTLALDFDLGHPPEKVWRALVEPDLLAQWLLPVIDFHLAPGAAFLFRTQPHPPWDGTVHCEMLEIEPQRKLAYTWNVPFLKTVVTFTLTPTPAGTRLSIVQTGFAADQKREFGGARYGWTMMGGRLAELLGRIP